MRNLNSFIYERREDGARYTGPIEYEFERDFLFIEGVSYRKTGPHDPLAAFDVFDPRCGMFADNYVGCLRSNSGGEQ